MHLKFQVILGAQSKLTLLIKGIPQINPEEAIGQKIGTGLAKAVNAAFSVKVVLDTSIL